MSLTVNVVRLSEAVLCEECKCITAARNHHCPQCGASGECMVRIEQFFERPSRVQRTVQTDTLRFQSY
jgi:hypothetical protein